MSKWWVLGAAAIGAMAIIAIATQMQVSSVNRAATTTPTTAVHRVVEIEPATTTNELPPVISYLGSTTPMSIAGVPVQASVATTSEARRRGLSGVPALLPNEVKLFVFDRSDHYGFWMPDMLFSIDIMWLNDLGAIVYIEESVSPDTYPTVFQPPVPARYVVETSAGFVATHGVRVGDRVVLPE